MLLAKMQIFLDITRIYARSWRVSPTGIDRVEWAYAQHLKSHDKLNLVFTLPMASGQLTAQRSGELLEQIRLSWGEMPKATEDPIFLAIGTWLRQSVNLQTTATIRLRPPKRSTPNIRSLGAPLGDLLRGSKVLTRTLGHSSGEKRCYINVSHLQIEHPVRLQWTQKNDVPVTLMLHDTIPIDYPEFCRPGSAEQHKARLRGAAQMRARLILNSNTTRDRVLHNFQLLGLPVPDMLVAPLGLDERFAPSAKIAAPTADTPYFVCVGTIEPRKNLTFLLEVWRRLVERHGTRTPRLVLVGHRGWENENIIDILERARQIAPFVAEISGLTDAGLASLMAGASAVLAPSLVEGYSLPCLEALACGAPVLASDIAVHREVCGDHAELIDVVDGPGWISAIEHMSGVDDPLTKRLQAQAAKFMPMRWQAHINSVTDFIAQD